MGVAFEQFKESLELASALRQLERDHFPAAPRTADQASVKGLRGGAAVLMVAAFEFFLRKLFEDGLSRLNSIPVSIDFQKLPNELQIKTVFHSLKRAMEGPMFETKLPKIDRISEILAACKLLISEHINPFTFSETGSNPNGETVREKFKDVGIQDVFGKIKDEFETKWGSAVPNDFIKSKLDEIVRARNVVAHTADTLHITRTTQNEAMKFLKILAELLERELNTHIVALLVIAKK